ncbi:hypothetical protein ABZZ20_28730 [Streptomyces sp. NPDC006430]|uniref:hypothetical protein n=1 Tax=Streptomyces sp. NPDC006430 TaxID=3154299 RepID=UPI0033A83C23
MPAPFDPASRPGREIVGATRGDVPYEENADYDSALRREPLTKPSPCREVFPPGRESVR